MDNASDLIAAPVAALPNAARLAGETVVVKIGGSTLGNHDTTLADVVTLQGLGVRVVVVHGGGAVISGWLKRIGKVPEFVDGLRVTDAETMELVVMALAGKVNKDLVSGLQTLGGKAIGLCGLDGALLTGVRKDARWGQVGKVTRVDLGPIEALASAGYVPVIAPIALGEGGEALNLNADTAAAEVAAALGARELLFLTDVPGVKGADGEVIAEMTEARAQELIASGVISGGMIPKVQACLRGLAGAKASRIVDGRVPHALIENLLTDRGVGTKFSV